MKVVQALRVGVPVVKKSDTGFIAKVLINAAPLSEPLKASLQEILVGEWNSDRDNFSCLVCDNFETPIQFETESEAMDQSRKLGDSLVKRYSYGLYAAHGVIVNPEEQAGATLHFFRNGRP